MSESSQMCCEPRTVDPRPCEYCGTVFTPQRPWGRFCTDDCLSRWHQENPYIPNPLERDEEFQMTIMNPNPSFRARKDGDHFFIDFEVSKEEWEWFTDPNIDRTGMVLELNGMVTHRAQKMNVAPETKPKGGQLAQEAGKMCGNPRFRDFIRDQYPEIWAMYDYGTTTEQSAACVRKICGVLSRAEIDSQPMAKKRFMDIMHEFSMWSLEGA